MTRLKIVYPMGYVTLNQMYVIIPKMKAILKLAQSLLMLRENKDKFIRTNML